MPMKDKNSPVESSHTEHAGTVRGDTRKAPSPRLATDGAKDVPKNMNSPTAAVPQPQREFGGPKGLEPTRYGDWERNGRCYDF